MHGKFDTVAIGAGGCNLQSPQWNCLPLPPKATPGPPCVVTGVLLQYLSSGYPSWEETAPQVEA